MAVKKEFELQQVLNYRAELEKACKQEFAAARQDLSAAEDVLYREKIKADELADEFTERQQQIDSIVEMRLYTDFFARKREELKEHQRRVEALDRVLEDRRQELVAATKEKKVMEQLKEKQKEEFRKQVAYKEGLLLDEIATQKKKQE